MNGKDQINIFFAGDFLPFLIKNKKKITPMSILFSLGNLFARATIPVLTSDKEEKHIILPTSLNLALRGGKLRIKALQNTLKVI